MCARASKTQGGGRYSTALIVRAFSVCVCVCWLNFQLTRGVHGGGGRGGVLLAAILDNRGAKY